MTYSVLIVPVLLPVLFWAWYHYHKDRHLPEPVSHLLIAFLLGVASFWIGKSMYTGLGLLGLRYDAFALADSNRFALLLYAIFAIGPIEEIAKFIPFIWVIRYFREFDEPIDGIIYASFIALGFAAVENVVYFRYLTSLEAMARGFAGPVVHIAFASIWGYYIGRAWLEKRRRLATMIIALSGTALIHGLYDYLVIALPLFALPASAALIVGIWVWRIYLIRSLHREARS